MARKSYEVTLYVYDLSNGLAKSLSLPLIGKQIDGIWHTSIVVHDTEYYFGGGICQSRPGQTSAGTPVELIKLGETELEKEDIQEVITELSNRFTTETYDIFKNNCNNFSDEFSELLIGSGIPNHITNLPGEIMTTPFGQMIMPFFESLKQPLVNEDQNSLYRTNNHINMQFNTESTSQSCHMTSSTLQNEVEEVLKREFDNVRDDENLNSHEAISTALHRVKDQFLKDKNEE